MMNNECSVQVDGLRVVRGGRVVLGGVSCAVRPGEVVGLLGPSGCGKSTLMRSIVGVQRVASGTVEVLGRPAGSASLRRHVGYVTQAPSVYGDLTVRENLAFFARVARADSARVDEVIEAVALGECADRLVGRLSGGQFSRTSLGVSLLNKPEVLILDEPTVGLDPLLRRQLWETFAVLAGAGTAILISSHVMDEASRCNRLLLMRDGAIIADNSLPGLLARTGTHDIENAFMALVTTEGQAA